MKIFGLLKYLFKPFIDFFVEIKEKSKGRSITILWIIISFFGLVALSETYFKKVTDKYSFGVDISNVSSNDHILFRVNKKSQEYDDLVIGQYIMFYTDKMRPHISSNVAIIKKVVAKQGDHVQVKGLDLYINGKHMAKLRPQALEKLEKTEQEMQKDFIVSKNSVIVLGSYERSFDSRYWGELTFKEGEKINQAIPFLF